MKRPDQPSMIGDEPMKELLKVRMTKKLKDKVRENGGSRWIRKLIEQA